MKIRSFLVKLSVLISFMTFSFFTLLVHAEQVVKEANQSKPTWELGVALGGQYLAEYRGSNEYSTNLVPIPFFVYRGDRVKLDRRGLRGSLLNSNIWEINLSGEASLTGGQNNSALREGMPELDSTFEIGPSINIALDGNVKDDGWLLRLPMRAVFAAGSGGVEYVGYLANPKFTYTKDMGEDAWRFSSSLGFSYGSEKFHDYYYEVTERFVLDDRPFYDARAGYSGAYFKASFIRRSSTWRYGISVRYDNISHTHFSENSPLVETDDYFAVSFILAKFLWASDD